MRQAPCLGGGATPRTFPHVLQGKKGARRSYNRLSLNENLCDKRRHDARRDAGMFYEPPPEFDALVESMGTEPRRDLHGVRIHGGTPGKAAQRAALPPRTRPPALPAARGWCANCSALQLDVLGGDSEPYSARQLLGCRVTDRIVFSQSLCGNHEDSTPYDGTRLRGGCRLLITR